MLDGFEVLGELGRGSHGRVLHARDRVLGREVALKFVSAQALDDERIRARFLEEAQRLAAVDHPNVARIWNVLDTATGPVLVLDLVRGTTLRALADRRFAARELATLGAQLAGALQAVHACGLVHRDLDPDNVMLDERGRAVLLDFGAERSVHAARQRGGQVPGEFDAPEVHTGGGFDVRTDVFALGSLLRWLARGRRLSRALEAVLRKATHAGREQRYATAAALAADLRAVASAPRPRWPATAALAGMAGCAVWWWVAVGAGADPERLVRFVNGRPVFETRARGSSLPPPRVDPDAQVHAYPDANGSSLDAMVEAASNGTVRIAGGPHRSNLRVPHAVTIEGEQGAVATILDGHGDGPVLHVVAGGRVVLRGVTVRAGGGQWRTGPAGRSQWLGGGLMVEGGGSAVLEHCVLEANGRSSGPDANDVTHGGACYVEDAGSELRLVHCLVIGNAAVFGGSAGIAARGGRLVLENCTVVGNRSSGPHPRLGALASYQGGTLELVRCIVWGNQDGHDVTPVASAEPHPDAAGQNRVHVGKDSFVPHLTTEHGDPGFVAPWRGDFRLRQDAPLPQAGCCFLR